MQSAPQTVLTVKEEEGAFFIEGPIDENADLSVIESTKLEKIILDLEGLSKINSYGVKKFSQMLFTLKEREIVYRSCPAMFIDQLNLIVDFLRNNISVESFRLPYYCSDCDIEAEIMIQTKEVKDPDFKDTLDERYKCEDCGEYMEFYEDDEIYFDFLEQRFP